MPLKALENFRMALKKCGECEHDVSSNVEKCPNCAAPVARKPLGCASGYIVLLLRELGFMIVRSGAVVGKVLKRN